MLLGQHWDNSTTAVNIPHQLRHHGKESLLFTEPVLAIVAVERAIRILHALPHLGVSLDRLIELVGGQFPQHLLLEVVDVVVACRKHHKWSLGAYNDLQVLNLHNFIATRFNDRTVSHGTIEHF